MKVTDDMHGTIVQCANEGCRRFIRVGMDDVDSPRLSTDRHPFLDGVKAFLGVVEFANRRLLRLNRTPVTVGPNAQVLKARPFARRFTWVVGLVVASLAVQAILGWETYSRIWDRASAFMALMWKTSEERQRANEPPDPEMGTPVPLPVEEGAIAWMPLKETDVAARYGRRDQAASYTIMIPGARRFRHNFQVVEKDDTANQRVIEEIVANVTDGLWMDAGFFYDARAKEPPKSVFLSFVAVSDEARYSGYRLLKLQVNGVPLELGDVKYDSRQVSGKTVERVSVEMGLRAFVAMLQTAETMGGRIGATEFTLRKGHIEALRELVSRVPLGKNSKYETIASE